MSAITIRNLPEPVHAGLRQMAAAGNLSVEALVRNLLAAAAGREKTTEGAGMSESSMPWGVPPAAGQPTAGLWGALKGCVQVPPETDLSAPTGDIWEAAR